MFPVLSTLAFRATQLRVAHVATLAHIADTSTAVPNFWLDWNFTPSLVIGIAAFIALYFYAAGPWRQKHGLGDPLTTGQKTLFLTSVAVLIGALLSPLDALGDGYLFGAHMIQHMLLAVVFPPLFLLSVPAWMVEPFFKGAKGRMLAKWIAHPVIAFGIFNGDMWLWHAPALYDATLANEAIHITEHLTFILLGVIFWLPVIGPKTVFPRLAPLFSVLYLFLGCQPMVVLGALLTFASQPFYAPYISAPRVWGMNPITDQQLGGLIMWIPTNAPYILALSVIFIKWVGAADMHERQAAEALFDDTMYILPTGTASVSTAEDAPATEGR